jgi:hypothetical protein
MKIRIDWPVGKDWDLGFQLGLGLEIAPKVSLAIKHNMAWHGLRFPLCYFLICGARG